MGYHVTVVDAKRHRVFLLQQRKDPFSKEVFKPGDRVVMCAGAGCNSAFLEDSWQRIGERHCGQTETLRTIRVEDEQPHFRKRAAPEEEYEPAARDAAADGDGAPPPAQEPTPRSGSRVRLREIPNRLRPSISLREI